MPNSKREQLLARSAAILGIVANADSGQAYRNLPRIDDVDLNAYVLHDGAEEMMETELAPGVVGNVCSLLPVVVVQFSATRADIGPLASAKLGAVQKAFLFDSSLLSLCGRSRQVGPRYIRSALTISEGEKITAEMIVGLAIKYVFKPSDLP